MFRYKPATDSTATLCVTAQCRDLNDGFGSYSVEKLYFLETLKSGQKQLQWKTQMIFIV